MAESVQAQLDKLTQTIAVLEAQRATLGEATVENVLEVLREKLAGLQAQLQAPPAPFEERRLITILFTDIVGSTALAEKLDPEEWRQTIAALHATVGNLVAQHQGHVAQYLGDGLLAFFGAEQASERDPENAIRAALAASSALPQLPVAHPIQIRVGIHTGLVVTGELGADSHKEFTATGDAMNLAACLQSAAPPGGVLVSHDTYRYVRGVFDVTPQPPLTVKGKSEPLQTYLVRRAKPRPFRSVTRGVAGVETRTIGRETEIQRLQEAYLEALGQRHMVWTQLVGEPGIGKSRLVEDLSEWLELRPETFRFLRARAFAGEAAQPFALVRRLWLDRFRIAEDAPLAQAEAKWVREYQELAGSEAVEPAHALGLLVGLPFVDSPHVAGMRNDPTQTRGRAFVVSRELLKQMRLATPVVLLLEDLQWADDSSWEWLNEVVLQAREEPDAAQGVFILGSARPEWMPPAALTNHAQYRRVDLAPLGPSASRALAQELLQRVAGAPEAVVELLAERSEGVPYYAEEMVNWFVDRGIIDTTDEPWQFVTTRLKESPLPATLQHLLLSRLSCLSEAERACLQRAAIFGRHFWTGGVQALGGRESETVFGHLQPRGFVVAQPESSLEGEQEWSFYHTLLREVTYESVLKRERAALHRAAAGWLEEQARQAGRLDEFAGLLGEHREKAGELLSAADWYLQAAARGMKQGAVREARRLYARALDLLPPIERERRWRGLLGHNRACSTLMEMEEFGAGAKRLVALSRELDDDGRLAEALFQERDYESARGHAREALRAMEEGLAAARRARDPRLELRGLMYVSVHRTVQGEHQAALVTAAQAVARARELGDEETLAEVLDKAAYCYGQAGDYERALQLNRESGEVYHRLGNRLQEGRLLHGLGANYLWLGLYKQARTAIEQAVERSEQVGARRLHAYNLVNLAEVHWFRGDYRTARRLLEQALDEEAALNQPRVRAIDLTELGLVLESLGDIAGATRRFTEARQVAQDAHYVYIEAEAAAGLARGVLEQGQLTEARELATEAWNYLREKGPAGMEHAMLAYARCAEVMDALGEPEQVRLIVEAGYRELMQRAGKIRSEAWRQSFLENDPFNRAMVDWWERIQG